MDNTTTNVPAPDGVITLEQARRAGLSARDVSLLVWSRRWVQIAPRTYEVRARPRR